MVFSNRTPETSSVKIYGGYVLHTVGKKRKCASLKFSNVSLKNLQKSIWNPEKNSYLFMNMYNGLENWVVFIVVNNHWKYV